MKTGVHFETYSALKEKRTKSLDSKSKEKPKKKDVKFEDDLAKLIESKKKSSFKEKPLKAFKNNYKNFQYDYEEDFYDPDYEEFEY